VICTIKASKKFNVLVDVLPIQYWAGERREIRTQIDRSAPPVYNAIGMTVALADDPNRTALVQWQLSRCLADGRRVLVICDTVRDVEQNYHLVQERYKDTNKRFAHVYEGISDAEDDRIRKEEHDVIFGTEKMLGKNLWFNASHFYFVLLLF